MRVLLGTQWDGVGHPHGPDLAFRRLENSVRLR